jgi:hypothetical protein
MADQDQLQQIMELVEVVGLVLLDQMVVQQQVVMAAMVLHLRLQAPLSLMLVEVVDRFMHHLQLLELVELVVVAMQVLLPQELQEQRTLVVGVVVVQEILP